MHQTSFLAVHGTPLAWSPLQGLANLSVPGHGSLHFQNLDVSTSLSVTSLSVGPIVLDEHLAGVRTLGGINPISCGIFV